jgi:hyperosmotically inducible protein
LAKSSGPAATVIDRLQVEPEQIARTDYNEGTAKVDREKAIQLGDSVGDSLDDSWIHSTIIRKLLRDPETPVANIHVDVQKGVVTLRGKVGSTDQKAEAQRVAQNIDGVKRVNNRIKVKA